MKLFEIKLIKIIALTHTLDIRMLYINALRAEDNANRFQIRYLNIPDESVAWFR